MIEVNHLSKYFSRPEREAGLKGAFKSLFTPKKVITKAVDDISFHERDPRLLILEPLRQALRNDA